MKQITVLAIAAVLIVGYAGIAAAEQCLLEAIAFTSSRDYPGAPLAFASAEIYLMNPDGTNPRRLTENTYGDGFAKPSPNGKKRKIVFDSNRLRVAGEPVNTSDLFVMNTDGTEQMLLTRAAPRPGRRTASTSRSTPRRRAQGCLSMATRALQRPTVTSSS